MNRIISRMISVSIAFIIFGIIDNGLMIIAGSTIDHFLGSAFHLSTMASAGLGNTFSDIVGIVSGRYVEHFCHSFLSNECTLSKNKVILSEAIGITLGCLIGMFPLLLLK